MTKDDILTTEADGDGETTGQSHPFLGQVLFYLGICLPTGAISAIIADGLQGGFGWPEIAIGLVFTLIGIALVWYAIRIGNFEPPSLSNKAGRNQLILLFSAGLGALASIYLILSGRMVQIVEGEFALSTIEAVVALVLLFGVLMPIAFVWHRQMDEHEAAAAQSGAYWALNVYLYLYIGWAIAAAADLTPPVHDFTLFTVVTFVFLGMWAGKRSG